MLKQAFNSKKKRKSTSGYPMFDPKGAKPLKDPQADMRTWRPPAAGKPSTGSGNQGIKFYPGAKFAKKHKGTGKKKGKNWIAGAIKKPGALHRQMGVKAGQKIPASKLARAASKGGKLGQRARLAETLKGFHKKGKGNKVMCKKSHKHGKMC